jgi:Bacterial capsule synthesis protein PGA_cap
MLGMCLMPAVQAEAPMEDNLPKFVNCSGAPVDPMSNDIRLAATGDLVFSENTPINRNAFAEFMPLLTKADLVLGNLEGPITDANTPRKPYVPGRSYSFRYPIETAQILKKANFHILSIANNHAQDYGPTGFADTQRHLTAAGIEHTGLKGSYVIRPVKGIKIGVIALAHYPMYNNVLEIEATAKLVGEVRAKSDLVILFYQLGGEGDAYAMITNEDEVFLGEQRGNPRKFAAAMIKAGAGALIAHGPHLVRAAECINGVPVLHSIGNFISAGGLSVQNLANVSAFPEMLFDASGKFKSVRIVPVTFTPERLPKIDSTGRSVHLINWLNSRATKTIPEFQALSFSGYTDQADIFEKWFRSTRFGAQAPRD